MLSANKEKLHSFFQGTNQYQIPFFQRSYVWKKDNWEELWDNIIEEKKTPNELKLDNLQKCYNYSFWISAGIKKLDKDATNFLSSILKYLETNLKISEKQKIGVNKWLKNLDNIPQIK